MKQNNISRLESPDYGKATISSLKRIADAFDVALVVRFVPFSQYVNWLSETPFTDFGLNPESMAVPSYLEEESAKAFDSCVNAVPSQDVFMVGGIGSYLETQTVTGPAFPWATCERLVSPQCPTAGITNPQLMTNAAYASAGLPYHQYVSPLREAS